MGCTHGCYWTRLQRFGQRSAFRAVDNYFFVILCEILVNFVLKRKNLYSKPRLVRFFLTVEVYSFSFPNQCWELRPQRLGMAHFQLSHFRFLTSCNSNYTSPYSRIWRSFPDGDGRREGESYGPSISWVAPMAVTGRTFSALVKEVPSELSANNTLCSFVKP
jgi:hypothetical protein